MKSDPHENRLIEFEFRPVKILENLEKTFKNILTWTDLAEPNPA